MKFTLLDQLIAVILAVGVAIADKSNGYAFPAFLAAELLLIAKVWQALSCSMKERESERECE